MVDRLSPLDASFLTLETASTPMQTGGIGIFEPGLRFEHVTATLSARLGRVRLARKRVQQAPLGAGPAWVDDTDFDLSFHLRHAALPAPGDARRLGEFLSRLISRPFDRNRPLWELYFIEGLEGGRAGLFRKVHLCWASDSTDLFSALLDEHRDAPLEAGLEDTAGEWTAGEPPSAGALAVDAVRERAWGLLEAGARMRDLAATPRRLAGAAASAAGSAVGVVARIVRPAPPSPLNARLTPHRRYAMVRLELDDLRRVRRAFGGSINDAVVAIAGDAIGRLLRWRGHDTKDLDLRVMVPVRVEQRAPSSAETMDVDTVGGGVVGVLAPLPVMDMDPVARLYRVMGELAGLRESRQAVAASDLAKLAGFAPSYLHALAARVVSAEQRYNVALSNAPGPQTARFLRGVALAESYPFIPLAGDAALSIAVSSYAGGMFVGLLGDRRSMADLDRLAEFTCAAASDLVDKAGS